MPNKFLLRKIKYASPIHMTAIDVYPLTVVKCYKYCDGGTIKWGIMLT